MNECIHKIYEPVEGKAMKIAVFASGGGNNLQTAIEIADEYPSLMKVDLVVTDRFGIPAIDMAEQRGIPVIAADFEQSCGKWQTCKNNRFLADAYQNASENFHDLILDRITIHEQSQGECIDLAVLSYHRLIRGKLLSYFNNRMINQHPGDLTIMKSTHRDVRQYTGLSPVFDALQNDLRKTRTTNFLVREGVDNGEILCQGPWTDYGNGKPISRQLAHEHELLQKKVSDKPCLRFVLLAIAQGRFGIHRKLVHRDGCRLMMLDEAALPYGGVDLT